MLDTIISSNITLTSFLICTAVSLVLGICTALVVTYRSKSTQSFALTLAVLPVVVQMVIMLVLLSRDIQRLQQRDRCHQRTATGLSESEDESPEVRQ